jgi:hypothetical protein
VLVNGAVSVVDDRHTGSAAGTTLHGKATSGA